MNQDETGFFDVYGPLVVPFWKKPIFLAIVLLLCLALAGLVCRFLYKRFYKKKQITDFEQLILHRTLLDKTHNSAVLLYDYVVRILKDLIPQLPQKSSLTAKELITFIKNHQNEPFLQGSGDQLIEIIERSESVRFGKENFAWDVVHGDVDYVIVMTKKIQFGSKKQ